MCVIKLEESSSGPIVNKTPQQQVEANTGEHKRLTLFCVGSFAYTFGATTKERLFFEQILWVWTHV